MRGLLVCNGPDLEKEWEEFKDKDIDKIVAVNHAPTRVDIGRWYGWISLDWRVWEPPPDKHRVVIKWENKQGQDSQYMQKDDFPFLVNNGFAMFSAIHLLACVGCTDIIGIGINLRCNPDGTYFKSGTGKNADHIFTRIKEVWTNYTEFDLVRMGISFISDTLCTP